MAAVKALVTGAPYEAHNDIVWSPPHVVLIEVVPSQARQRDSALCVNHRLPCSVEHRDQQILRAFAAGQLNQCTVRLVLRIQDLADVGLLDASQKPLLDLHDAITGVFTTSGAPLMELPNGARLIVRHAQVAHNCVGFSRPGANLLQMVVMGIAPRALTVG